ncbi:MAG: hypothetical protein JNK82_21745, partial [Myxococcaceae bacterium]|nr:hypothetical protein [Myxococcaceae bacterium]
MSPRRLVAAALLMFVACDRGTVTPIADELDVSPASLDFGDVYLGFPATKVIGVGNRTVADRRLDVVVTGPFWAPPQLLVPGGAQVELAVTFTPDTTGSATGTLSISEGGEPLTVALRGNGLDVPACAAAPACRVNVFEVAAGACVERVAGDGTTCTNVCIANGTCSSGVCLGTSSGCDDGDRCTTDACDPARGCTHLPVECAMPSNPCKAAACDPVLGCTEADVRDGTSCGPSDCVTSRVCVLGACQALATPDGTSCGTATPCQAQGSCARGACVSAPRSVMNELWGYTFPSIPYFEGVSDAAQNLYWFECGAVCSAVSFTREGVERWRTGVANLPEVQQHLLEGNRLFARSRDRLIALEASDGSGLWSVAMTPEPAGAP